MFFYEIFDEHLKTEKINYKIQYIETIESTNQYAWNLITKNIKNATVVITKNQTNGKGQRENKWFASPNKSLTFSIIMKVNKKYDELLSLKTGISVIDGIKKNTSIDCHLKWPNDIMINEKKIGGILIEKKKDNIVIGIGINVNEDLEHINPLVKKYSTSLKIMSNLSIQLEKLLANILNEFEYNYYQTNYKNIIKIWEKNCCHINKNIKFHKDYKIISGKFAGLANNGNAIINIDGEKYIMSGGIINL